MGDFESACLLHTEKQETEVYRQLSSHHLIIELGDTPLVASGIS
jgi:hypothetical protein